MFNRSILLLSVAILITSPILLLFPGILKFSSSSAMPPKPKLNVQKFPRPPLLEKTSRHLQIKWHGQTIADTRDAYWVLETYHPPTYYLPPTSLLLPLSTTKKSTFCEYKGWATYHSIALPNPNPNPNPTQTTPTPAASTPTPTPTTTTIINDKIWSYQNPTPAYRAIKGYLSFYAGPHWDCFVDGERVTPQPGDFYGGWTTSELEGTIKGSPGTRWM